MPPKKNRLDDARRRLQEKLDAIQEQSEYITQTLNNTVTTATNSAVEILNLQDKKKFFHNYPQISQQLEKCLDFLLALSDTVDAFDDDSEPGSDDEGEKAECKAGTKGNEQSKKKLAANISTHSKDKLETNKKKPELDNTKPVNTETTVNCYGDNQVKNKYPNHGVNKLSTLKTIEEIISHKISEQIDIGNTEGYGGTSAEKNRAFEDKIGQLSSKHFCSILEQKVDMDNMKLDLVKTWVTKRITEIRGFKDYVTLMFIFNALDSKNPNPRFMQIGLTSFLGADNASIFMNDLWKLLLNGQDDVCRIPSSFNKSKEEKDHVENDSLPKEHTVKSDSSQLKMPKAFSQKCIKRDKKGCKSPSIAAKEVKESILEAVQLKPYPFNSGHCLEVVVTEVLSPWELWIQPADQNGFNLLMEKMCLHFAKAAASGYKGGLTVPPSIGDYCCARFMSDDTWYRVVVIGIHQCGDNPSDSQGRFKRRNSTSSSSSTSSIDSQYYPGLEIEVLCVDDGSRDRLPMSRLRRLDSSLVDIPCQALCCALNGVQPLVKNPVKSQGDSVWKDESIHWLRNKVSGVKLLAYPRRTEDDAVIIVDLYMASFKKKQGPGTNRPMKGDTMPGLQQSIAHIMVLEGFALHTGHVTSSTTYSKSSSLQSVTIEEQSISRSNFSVTSPNDGDKSVLRDESITQCVNDVIEKFTDVTENSKRSLQEKQDSKTHADSLTGVNQEKRPKKDKKASKTKKGACSNANDVTKVTQLKDIAKRKGTFQDGDEKKITEITEEATKLTQKNVSHSKPSYQPSNTQNDVQEKPLEKPEKHTPEVTHQKSQDNVTQDSVSPRYPPEGSSRTESIKDLTNVTVESSLTVCGQFQDQPLFLQVMMSEVLTPSEFYVHLVTPEAVLLAELTEDLDSYYKDSDTESMPEDYRLCVGDYCCAKFSKDNLWCRAKVLEVQVTPTEEGSSERVARIYVFYVDYGNSEWVAMGDTRPLQAKFMMLPGFAVKSRLAGIQPLANEDETEDPIVVNEVEQIDDAQRNEDKSIDNVKKDEKDKHSSPTKLPTKDTNANRPLAPPRRFSKGKRGRKNKKLPLHDRNVVLRAAGDESGDSELSDGGLIFDLGKNDDDDEKKTKSVEDSALPEKYLVASPEKAYPPDTTINRKPEWSEEAVELFRGLTGDDKPLRGVMVPWNATTYQQVYYPSASYSFVDITYQRPTLVLQLYDTTGDEDVDVIQIMVETGLAQLVDENLVEEGDVLYGNVAKTLHLSVADLEKTADQLNREGKDSTTLLDSDSDDDIMAMFNPMMDDYKSSRNAYGIGTSDLDIAVHGFKPIETQYCKFYRSAKNRCWRGENCPMLHVKEGEDATVRVQAFCNNNDFTVELPKLGSWVGVRVTAVINPGHFWIQFPCGSGPIEKKIIEERLGLSANEDIDEESFDAMLDRMNKFYSRNFFRESTSILPAPGELSVAKYSQNERWYRACVLDVMDDTVKVSFLDFGNTEWTASSNVKRMLPQFLHMPFQAVECFLGNVEPIEEGGKWTQESKKVFESLTEDKLLIGHVLSISGNNTMWLELFDTQNELDININVEMIKKGFAYESPVKITIPTCPGSASSIGSVDSFDDVVFVPG